MGRTYIESTQIRDGDVTNDDLAPEAVTLDKCINGFNTTPQWNSNFIYNIEVTEEASPVDWMTYVYDNTTGKIVLKSTQIEEIPNLINGDYNNNLTEAYNQDGPGLGRTITIDNGPIVLDASTGTNAALEIPNVSTAPTTNIGTEPQLQVINNILCMYDVSRAKWLSVERQYLAFGRKGKTLSMFLNFYSSAMASNNSGLRLVRDACIVSMSGQIGDVSTCDFHVRKDNGATNIATLSLTSAIGDGNKNLNVDTIEGEFLQSYIDVPSGTIDDPMVIVEIAWRMS